MWGSRVALKWLLESLCLPSHCLGRLGENEISESVTRTVLLQRSDPWVLPFGLQNLHAFDRSYSPNDEHNRIVIPSR